MALRFLSDPAAEMRGIHRCREVWPDSGSIPLVSARQDPAAAKHWSGWSRTFSRTSLRLQWRSYSCGKPAGPSDSHGLFGLPLLWFCLFTLRSWRRLTAGDHDANHRPFGVAANVGRKQTMGALVGQLFGLTKALALCLAIDFSVEARYRQRDLRTEKRFPW